MFDELIHSIMEQWSHVAETFFRGVDAPKVLSFLIPIVPASYGVYIKWSNSGYRLLDRLDEFLGQQEKRLEHSRQALALLFECPSPARPLDEPAFQRRGLGRSLRKMNWGYGAAATNDLSGAVNISISQIKKAEQQIDEFQKRQALAHLLLGAKEASRNLKDQRQRRASREAALEHFDRAIDLNAKDADAIEYAGMMLLELANPAGALERFNQLIVLRLDEGGIQLARAYRLLATAHEQLPSPQNGPANIALGNALATFPDGVGLEKALTHEHRGNVRVKLQFYPAANKSFQDALTIYQSIRTTSDGQAGLARVNAAIAALNNVPMDNNSATLLSPPVGPTGNWLSKFAKPNG
jgi:tetratricopeptide (TPR) repeat protein